MCGIAAIFSRTNAADDHTISIRRMVDAMGHRGPDNTGIRAFTTGALGHTRLSVIDTSVEGNQPMTRNGVTIVYNGECYNFQEEKKSLESMGYRFQTNTDTEVLLSLYMAYGERFVERLRGIFAFIIFDTRKQILLCARDQLGVKPILYAAKSGKLILCSELKAMLASGQVERQIDRDSLQLLLRTGSVPQPKTILKDVKCLMPGHLLRWQNGNTQIKPYWRMATGRMKTKHLSYPEMLEECRRILSECLRMQLVSDVPLGAFLSGGIDSSLMVALMQREHGNVRTFSVGFEGGLDTISEDETTDAERVAEHLGCQHETIIVSQNEICEQLSRIAHDLDHPSVDGVNSWFVSKVAANDLTVAISGTGGDELFAGYPWFAAMKEQNGNEAKWKRTAKTLLRKCDFVQRYSQHYFIFDPESTKRILPDCQPGDYKADDPIPYANAIDRTTGLTLSGYTRNQLLFDIDTAAMAHSLEVRVPMLDIRLLDFALSLPSSAKIGGQDPSAPQGSYAHAGVKRILIDIGREMLPADFDLRAKRGFILPFDGWLRGVLSSHCEELLAGSVVKNRGFFDPKAVAKVYADFKEKKVYWPQVWLLMMTELWAQQVLDK